MLVVAIEREAVEAAGAHLPVEVERHRLLGVLALVQRDLEPPRLADVVGARQRRRVGVVRERRIELDLSEGKPDLVQLCEAKGKLDMALCCHPRPLRWQWNRAMRRWQWARCGTRGRGRGRRRG